MLFHVCHVIAFDQIRDLVMANFRMDVTAHFQGIQEWVVEQGTIRPGFRRGPVEEFQIERRIVCEDCSRAMAPPAAGCVVDRRFGICPSSSLGVPVFSKIMWTYSV